MPTTVPQKRIVRRSAGVEARRTAITPEIVITGATRTKLVGSPSTIWVRPKNVIVVRRMKRQIERGAMERIAVVTITDTLRISAVVGVKNHIVTILGGTKSGQVQSVINHPAAMETARPNPKSRPHTKVAAKSSVAPMAYASGPSSITPEVFQVSSTEGNQRALGGEKTLPMPMMKSPPRPKRTSERRYWTPKRARKNWPSRPQKIPRLFIRTRYRGERKTGAMSKSHRKASTTGRRFLPSIEGPVFSSRLSESPIE